MPKQRKGEEREGVDLDGLKADLNKEIKRRIEAGEPVFGLVIDKAEKTKQSTFDAVGIDAVCNDLSGGVTMTAIAGKQGVSVQALCQWIAADPSRSARVREARTEAAKLWDELATDGIQNAKDPFELAKAKEIAHHYRWRASKIAPKEYGDKIDHTIGNPDGSNISMAVHFVAPVKSE